ncbi:uncharacterized protein BCR38DRAFT_406388 [Pseudomassariella vexata]|uniref:Alcohol dehydrogenase-like N-terminal domain-containing protein n=1 Tax=Pseudomassariella vexata TaxID=1141098 RepID=A0A1Y2EB28_9PEZI|nr:uncharacterized protein BCR38DRAFT_406388 [Pseudomassariella vexata]ORY68466.1 hypothetical protein BCR38DRAFT_406388 [Pseudomassariella vexata]
MPFNLHQADGGIGAQYPQIMGATIAGVVEAVEPKASRFKKGDEIFARRKSCFDYRGPNVTTAVLESAAKNQGTAKPVVPMIIDCIGSQAGTLEPLSRIAESGSTVAAIFSVIVKVASKEEAPEYFMDALSVVPWADGVDVRGVRMFVYQVGRQPPANDGNDMLKSCQQSEFFKEKLPPESMPAMLSQGFVTPQRY